MEGQTWHEKKKYENQAQLDKNIKTTLPSSFSSVLKT